MHIKPPSEHLTQELCAYLPGQGMTQSLGLDFHLSFLCSQEPCLSPATGHHGFSMLCGGLDHYLLKMRPVGTTLPSHTLQVYVLTAGQDFLLIPALR